MVLEAFLRDCEENKGLERSFLAPLRAAGVRDMVGLQAMLLPRARDPLAVAWAAQAQERAFQLGTDEGEEVLGAGG